MAAANVLHSKPTHWRHLKIGEFGMKTLRKIILPFALLLLSGSAIFGADNSAPTEKTFDAPNDLKVSVKMIGPYSEPGKEKDLSLDALHLVGRVAAREAVRLQAKHVAWAPVVRDQGNTTLDVGQGDRAFIEQMLSAYDTEKRLQAQKLAPLFNIETVVIEAGPAYFEGAAKLVSEGIKSMATEIAKRSGAPYTPTKTE